MAASTTLRGVGKSGSPAPKPITFSPAAFSALALASTARVADSWMAAMRAEMRDAEVATAPWWHVAAPAPERFAARAVVREPVPPSLEAHAPPLSLRRVRRCSGLRLGRDRPYSYRYGGGRGTPVAQSRSRRRRRDRAD